MVRSAGENEIEITVQNSFYLLVRLCNAIEEKRLHHGIAARLTASSSVRNGHGLSSERETDSVPFVTVDLGASSKKRR